MAHIIINSLVLQNWQFTNATVEMRIAATQAFVTSDNIPIQPGPYYQPVTCTPDLVAQTLTIPQIAINSTQDSLDNQFALYAFSFWSGPGAQAFPLGVYRFGMREQVFIPATPSPTTFGQIEVENNQQLGAPPFNWSGAVNIGLQQLNTPVILENGDSSPFVGLRYNLVTANTVTTNITDLRGAYPGQIISLTVNDIHTSVFGVPYTSGTLLYLQYINGAWRSVSPTAGLSSINGRTDPNQTLVTGTAGNDFNIAESGAQHVFNLPDAGQSARGVISTGDQAIKGHKRFQDDLDIGSIAAGKRLNFPNINGGNTSLGGSSTALGLDLTLPDNAGAGGQVLSTDGVGHLSWINAGGGGGGGTDWGIFDPRTFGAIGDGVTNDTTAFTNMLAAIGSIVATVIIPRTSGPFLLGNITFPPNVTLDFFAGGGIKVVSSRTVMIQGKVIAQSNRIFFNIGTIAAGLGVVSFGNTSPTNSTDGFPPQQKNYWAEWWGAVGDNVTHSADLLDAAFEALPNGCAMYLAGKFYYLEHGVTFGYKVSCSLIGNATEAGISGNLNKPIFVYQGAAGGTAFTAVNTYSCTFHGFGIYGSNGSGDVAHQAATNFFLTELAGGVPSIVSHCYLTGLTLWALSARTDWIGIYINNGGGGADGNNEHHTIRECEFVGQQGLTNTTPQQAGINFGQSQVQRVIIERCNFSGLSVGVLIGGGNFLAYNNVFGNIGIPWYLNAPNDNCMIIGDDIENAGRLVTIVTINGPFTLSFIGGKYGGIGGGTNVGSSDAQTTAPIRIVSAGDISFYNCNLNNAGTIGQDFGPYLVGGPGSGSGTVEFNNCLIGTSNNLDIYAPGFSTCSTIYRKGGSEDRRWGGGVTTSTTSLLRVAAPTKAASRSLIDIAGPTAVASDPVTLVGTIGIGGLFPPTLFGVSTVGVAGSTIYHLTVIAVDALGRRTLLPKPDTNHYLSIATANAVLSGSNYVHLEWFSQFPVPAHFEVYEIDQSNAANWRFIANVSPSGGLIEHYDIVVNPAGPFVATQPSYNEAGIINLRNLTLNPIDTQFADGDTTPSVALSNDYYTANSALTIITNFVNGTNNQIIRVRIDDPNTTIATNANIITGFPGNIKTVQGVVYTFKNVSGVWHAIFPVLPGESLLATVPGVNMNTASPTTLFTVPTGRICVPTRVIVRNASTSLTTVSTSWGWTAAAYNDWSTTLVLTALTTSSNFRLINPINGAMIGTSGQTFKALNNVLQGAAATTTMDVIGYLI